MNMVDSALETLGDELQTTCITKILVALMKDSGGQKVPPISKFLLSKTVSTKAVQVRRVFVERKT